MSDNIPENSASALKKPHKRKHDKSKLPTPPPDPHSQQETHSRTTEKDKDFFEYLESLHKSINPTYARSTSTFAPVIATDEAFDHLEKLYKLMEQMLELREQNAKLHRRIRDLEHFNNIEKMHKQLEIAGVQRDYPELDKDTIFAETILESILSETKKDPKSRLMRPSILRRQRNRSASTVEKNPNMEEEPRRESCCFEGRLDKPAKVSKWTKVKAAFKWEKASTSVGVDSKSQDSGLGGMAPVNMEIARYLRVPSTSEELGHSPADSGAAGISTPGSLSTASSNEDFHRSLDSRLPCEDFRSSEDEHYIPHPKDEPGSNKSNHKFPRTPWAKMKDMIQTRNSFKKKQRLSAQSDDIQIDVELCSDNEDVFEEDNKTKPSSPSPNYSCTYVRLNSSEIPSNILARYQQVVAEDDKTNTSESRKISKWTRVKKAFLTPDHNPQSPTTPKPIDQDDNEEIQKNYKQLQKKLSLEFQEKLNEWERLKQNSPGTSNPTSTCGVLEDTHDPSFIKKLEEWQKIKTQQQPSNKNRTTNIPMTRQYDLPPEFKKKLQEWEKIKKSSAKEASKKKIGDIPRWKSLSGHRPETSHSSIEYPVLSDDFRKKLEEWKQIKASGIAAEIGTKKLKEKTPSPKLIRKNSSPKHSKKHKDLHEKELHWFEKELNKIEKEKLRLERERQKFLEREERLSKLRRSVTGGNKKEVLIHTPSGFYRFEGISRKFTQKLYEWEKSQGIKPEASTFALLSSPYIPENFPSTSRNRSSNSPPLVRSKSADSIAVSASTNALMNHQPSSLSLNDVDDLEKECLADSKSSSMQYLMQSQEGSDMDEPEALIVEVEDYEEETAAPLRTYARREQLPIYQREVKTSLCEGETVAAPKVRRSESTKAQTNYNLIEDIFNTLRALSENEFEIINLAEEDHEENNLKLQDYYQKQNHLSNRVVQKLLQLQDANSAVATSISKDSSSYSASNVIELLEAVQDLSTEILQMTEKMDKKIENRFKQTEKYNISLNIVLESLNAIRNKMLELRRNLSYICAASDLTAPHRKKPLDKKKNVQKTVSNESKDSRCETSDTSQKSSVKSTKEEPRYIKAEAKPNQSQGAVKKKIKYRQKSLQSRNNTPDTDEEDNNLTEQRKNKHKKLTRTRSTSESNTEKNFEEGEAKNATNSPDIDTTSVQKFIVPTETNYVNTKAISMTCPDSPVTLFVKTTRKLFTPIGESGVLSNTPEIKPEVDQTTPKTETSEATISSLPPIPASPVPQRKILKDMSPSIKIMLAKYNQKLEQDSANGKSGGSSGSASPIAWRSPTAERRVKAQTERYQEVLSKLSPLLGGRREVQKSASVGYLHTGNKQVTVPIRRDSLAQSTISETGGTIATCNLTKSSSARFISSPSEVTNIKTPLKPSLTINVSLKASGTIGEPGKYCHSPEIRMKKLQKAKEEFLRSTPTSAPPQVNYEVLKFPTRNRLSQISVDSESSYDSAYAGALIKSASAGMINIDPDTYRQFDPEMHGGGYVSLPRSPAKKPREGFLSGKFAFSNITSKFRKVKMRRGKERSESSKMGVVSTLCRQSLVVDINPVDLNQKTEQDGNAGETSRAKPEAWIKKARIFKK